MQGKSRRELAVSSRTLTVGQQGETKRLLKKIINSNEEKLG